MKRLTIDDWIVNVIDAEDMAIRKRQGLTPASAGFAYHCVEQTSGSRPESDYEQRVREWRNLCQTGWGQGMTDTTPIVACACGCGSPVNWYRGKPRRFITGHAGRRGSVVRVHPVPDPETGCHNWPGGVNQDGYGLLGRDGQSMSAHRWDWIQANGPIPEGMKLDHLCRNRRCCNPEHLEVVTNRENVMRGMTPTVIASRENRCLRGHAFTPENTVYKASGGRQCRVCMVASQRRYEARVRSERKQS